MQVKNGQNQTLAECNLCKIAEAWADIRDPRSYRIRMTYNFGIFLLVCGARQLARCGDIPLVALPYREPGRQAQSQPIPAYLEYPPIARYLAGIGQMPQKRSREARMMAARLAAASTLCFLLPSPFPFTQHPPP